MDNGQKKCILGVVEGSLKENQEFLEILLKTKEPPFYYGEVY